MALITKKRKSRGEEPSRSRVGSKQYFHYARSSAIKCILQTGSNTYADDSCVAFSYTWELTSPITSSLSQTRTWHIQLVSHVIRHASIISREHNGYHFFWRWATVIQPLVFRPSSLSKPYLFSNSRYLERILYSKEDDYFYYKTEREQSRWPPSTNKQKQI